MYVHIQKLLCTERENRPKLSEEAICRSLTPKVCNMRRQKLTDIHVVIVGAGLGGLFTAIELWRQGHHVQVLESKETVEFTGWFYQ